MKSVATISFTMTDNLNKSDLIKGEYDGSDRLSNVTESVATISFTMTDNLNKSDLIKGEYDGSDRLSNVTVAGEAGGDASERFRTEADGVSFSQHLTLPPPSGI
jgi:hypothetical protein